MAPKSVGHRVVHGFLKVLVFWLFWKFGGFLVGVLIARTYGTGPILDAYTEVYKNILFLFLFSSFLKVIVPAFMPIFIDEMNEKGEGEAWQFAASIINLTMIAAVVAVVCGMIYSAEVIDSLVPGFVGKEAGRHAPLLLRWMLPGALGLIFGVLTLGVLNSYKIFGYPAAADAAQKLVWAAVMFICVKWFIHDVRAIAIGFSAGCIAQVAVCLWGMGGKLKFLGPGIPAVRPQRMLLEIAILAPFCAAFVVVWKFAPDLAGSTDDARMISLTASLVLACGYVALLWHRARKISSTMARFVALAAPLAIGVIFARYRDLATFLFQSYTQQGVFGAMEYAKTVAFLPVVLIGYALSIALFPYLCEMAAKKSFDEFGELITRSLKMVILFFVPLAAAMIILDTQIIQLIYDKGNWPAEHIEVAGMTLSIFVVGLVFMAIENVTMQSFFSMKMTWQPTIVGIAMAFLHVAFLYVPISVFKLDHPSEIFLFAAISYPLSRTLKNILLLVWMRMRVRVLPLRETTFFVVKICIATGVMALAMIAVERVVNGMLPVDRYRSLEVMLDTFNRETPKWVSLEAAPSIKDDADGVFLRWDYRLTGRREIMARRDLTMFKLDGLDRVDLRVRRATPGIIAVRLIGKDGTTHSREQSVPAAGEWSTVGIAAAEFDPPLASGGFTSIQFVDVSPVQAEAGKTSFDLDDITLTVAGSTVLIDDFEVISPDWSAPAGLSTVVLKADKTPPEVALVLDEQGASRVVAHWDLSDTTLLTFKAVALDATKLSVSLDGVFTARIDLKQSESRKSYTLPISEFADASGKPPDMARVREVAFKPAAAGVRLDNIAFAQPRSRLKFELIKLLRTAVPAGVGGFVIVILLWLLKIEEARLIFNWFREEGLGRIKGKLGRGKAGQDGESDA